MRVLLLPALALALLAGCLEPSVGQIEEPGALSLDELIEAAVDDDGSGTVDDGYLLSHPVGPDAPLAGFAFQLPRDAAYDSDVTGQKSVTLQVIPLGLRQGLAVDASAVAVFVVRDGAAYPVRVQIDVPGTYESVTGDQAIRMDLVPHVRATELTFYADDLGRSDDLRIVLGAAGEVRDLEVLLLVSQTDFMDEGHERPTESSAARRLDGHRILRLAQTGSGAGIWAASHVEVHWPWANLDLLMQLGEVSFEEDELVTPAGPVATRVASAQAPSTQGWSAGMGYENSNDFAGEWSVAGAAHDLALEDRSPTMGFAEGPASLASIVVGYPIYEFTADGVGPVDVTMQVRGRDTSNETFRLFQVVTLGSPLRDLVGVPGVDSYTSYGAVSRWLGVGPDLPIP